jgi:hypothetical protein
VAGDPMLKKCYEIDTEIKCCETKVGMNVAISKSR